MPKIIANKNPDVGDEFNIFVAIGSGIGAVFSIIFGGKRVGTARVITDHSKNPRFGTPVHGGNVAPGKGYYRVKVERKF